MRFDFTIHFWPFLAQCSAVGSFVTFLWHVASYCKRKLIDPASQILAEHHEMYSWYQKVKAQGLE